MALGIVGMPEAVKPLDSLALLSRDGRVGGGSVSDTDTSDGMRAVLLQPSPARRRASPRRASPARRSHRLHQGHRSSVADPFDNTVLTSAVYSATSDDGASSADYSYSRPSASPIMPSSSAMMTARDEMWSDTDAAPSPVVEEQGVGAEGVQDAEASEAPRRSSLRGGVSVSVSVSPPGTPQHGGNVWERLVEEGDVRARNREAKYLLQQHHKQLQEESEMQVSRVTLQRPWKPSKKAVPDAPSHASRVGPGGEMRGVPDERFSFKPQLSEATQQIASGSGAKVWTYLTKKAACKNCSVSKEEPVLPLPHRLPKEELAEAYGRLYKDALKAKPIAHPVYSPKGFPFHPTISPNSERMVANRVQPFSERLFQNVSPRRRALRELQLMEVCVSGVAVRLEANVKAERVRVLRRNDTVEVDIDTMKLLDDELWGEVGDGWVMLVCDDGERNLVPSIPRDATECTRRSAYRSSCQPASIQRSRVSASPSPARRSRASIDASPPPSSARASRSQRRSELDAEIERLTSSF